MGKLSKFLAIKSVLDLAFVVFLAVYWQASLFPPAMGGSLDFADESAVSGWVVNAADAGRPVWVQLYLNDNPFASQLASEERQDVASAGLAPDGFHGFNFRLPGLAPGHYTVRVYAVNSSKDKKLGSLTLVGSPASFEVSR